MQKKIYFKPYVNIGDWAAWHLSYGLFYDLKCELSSPTTTSAKREEMMCAAEIVSDYILNSHFRHDYYDSKNHK